MTIFTLLGSGGLTGWGTGAGRAAFSDVGAGGATGSSLRWRDHSTPPPIIARAATAPTANFMRPRAGWASLTFSPWVEKVVDCRGSSETGVGSDAAVGRAPAEKSG